MTAHMTFFPLGNADTTLLRLASDDLVLLDYANMRCPTDPNDKRIDLPKALRGELADARRESFRVVAFTHLDMDHVYGASESSSSSTATAARAATACGWTRCGSRRPR